MSLDLTHSNNSVIQAYGSGSLVSVSWNPIEGALKHAHDAALAKAERIYLQGKEFAVTNRQTGEIIWVSKSGLRKAISGHSGIQKIRLVPYLPELLERGVFTGTAPDQKRRPDVLAYRYYVSQAAIDASVYEVKLVIREVREGKTQRSKFYDHEIRRISEAAGIQRAIDQ